LSRKYCENGFLPVVKINEKKILGMPVAFQGFLTMDDGK